MLGGKINYMGDGEKAEKRQSYRQPFRSSKILTRIKSTSSLIASVMTAKSYLVGTKPSGTAFDCLYLSIVQQLYLTAWACGSDVITLAKT